MILPVLKSVSVGGCTTKLDLMNTFCWPVRVYYEDTDSGGVVYYANYLRFMERARSEWLRSLGIGQNQLIERDGLIFVVRHVELNYLKPARFDDTLQVTVALHERGRASLTFDQQVLLDAEGESVVLCSGQVKIACVDAATMRPRAIPNYIQVEIDGVI